MELDSVHACSETAAPVVVGGVEFLASLVHVDGCKGYEMNKRGLGGGMIVAQCPGGLSCWGDEQR